MNTKAFAIIIAASSLAISLGWTAPGNSQDQGRLESQGKEVCRQSLLAIARLTVDAKPAAETFGALKERGWQTMSMPEKRIYVEALATLAATAAKQSEMMTLRKINSCPQDPSALNITEKTVEALQKDALRFQLRLGLDEAEALGLGK
jgi:hypothetical protein